MDDYTPTNLDFTGRPNGKWGYPSQKVLNRPRISPVLAAKLLLAAGSKNASEDGKFYFSLKTK